MNIACNIDGYTVQLEDESCERIQCWITIASEQHRASASLAALADTGLLDGWNNYADHAVRDTTIDKITDWANRRGYND